MNAQEIFNNLTFNEKAVMKSLFFNNYGDGGCGVWEWAVNDSQYKSGIDGKALSGVISSLCKKGIYKSEEYERNENVLYLTTLGREVMALHGFKL